MNHFLTNHAPWLLPFADKMAHDMILRVLIVLLVAILFGGMLRDIIQTANKLRADGILPPTPPKKLGPLVTVVERPNGHAMYVISGITSEDHFAHHLISSLTDEEGRSMDEAVAIALAVDVEYSDFRAEVLPEQPVVVVGTNTTTGPVYPASAFHDRFAALTPMEFQKRFVSTEVKA